MLKDISSIAVLVNDASKAAEWYHEKLGCDIVSKQGHWIAVKLPESSTVLHLCAKCDEWESDSPGGETGIGFNSDNKEKTYRELKAKGVEFAEELHTEWFGTFAKFKDLDGNLFWL
jgi:catechol 2,3-dioxygenase-like lactoylglutathione lyase family enzyme